MKTSFYQYSLHELKTLLKKNQFNTSVAAQLFNWHYKKKKQSPCVFDISKEALSFIDTHLEFDLPQIDMVRESQDKTVKFLLKLKDKNKVETVLIPFNGKYSICLSSQVGCAMKCSFCFTGTQGLTRNLYTDEIIGQFLQVWKWLEENRPGEEKILNIVFMGQGEPLHNFDAVKKACNIFLSQHGTSIGAQKITISTSGFLPGLKKWAEEIPGVNLALSLHSPFAQKRDQLIPINKRYPLEKVLKVIDELPLAKKQFVTYEYLLIKDFNDSYEDALEVGKLLQGKRAYINLIPFNPFPGTRYKRPDDETILKFKNNLDSFKVPTLIRKVKGDDVLAACGQLNTNLGPNTSQNQTNSYKE